jgi:hypothetical protein
MRPRAAEPAPYVGVHLSDAMKHAMKRPRELWTLIRNTGMLGTRSPLCDVEGELSQSSFKLYERLTTELREVRLTNQQPRPLPAATGFDAAYGDLGWMPVSSPDDAMMAWMGANNPLIGMMVIAYATHTDVLVCARALATQCEHTCGERENGVEMVLCALRLHANRGGERDRLVLGPSGRCESICTLVYAIVCMWLTTEICEESGLYSTTCSFAEIGVGQLQAALSLCAAEHADRTTHRAVVAAAGADVIDGGSEASTANRRALLDEEGDIERDGDSEDDLEASISDAAPGGERQVIISGQGSTPSTLFPGAVSDDSSSRQEAPTYGTHVSAKSGGRVPTTGVDGTEEGAGHLPSDVGTASSDSNNNARVQQQDAYDGITARVWDPGFLTDAQLREVYRGTTNLVTTDTIFEKLANRRIGNTAELVSQSVAFAAAWKWGSASQHEPHVIGTERDALKRELGRWLEEGVYTARALRILLRATIGDTGKFFAEGDRRDELLGTTLNLLDGVNKDCCDAIDAINPIYGRATAAGSTGEHISVLIASCKEFAEAMAADGDTLTAWETVRGVYTRDPPLNEPCWRILQALGSKLVRDYVGVMGETLTADAKQHAYTTLEEMCQEHPTLDSRKAYATLRPALHAAIVRNSAARAAAARAAEPPPTQITTTSPPDAAGGTSGESSATPASADTIQPSLLANGERGPPAGGPSSEEEVADGLDAPEELPIGSYKNIFANLVALEANNSITDEVLDQHVVILWESEMVADKLHDMTGILDMYSLFQRQFPKTCRGHKLEEKRGEFKTLLRKETEKGDANEAWNAMTLDEKIKLTRKIHAVLGTPRDDDVDSNIAKWRKDLGTQTAAAGQQEAVVTTLKTTALGQLTAGQLARVYAVRARQQAVDRGGDSGAAVVESIDKLLADRRKGSMLEVASQYDSGRVRDPATKQMRIQLREWLSARIHTPVVLTAVCAALVHTLIESDRNLCKRWQAASKEAHDEMLAAVSTVPGEAAIRTLVDTSAGNGARGLLQGYDLVVEIRTTTTDSAVRASCVSIEAAYQMCIATTLATDELDTQTIHTVFNDMRDSNTPGDWSARVEYMRVRTCLMEAEATRTATQAAARETLDATLNTASDSMQAAARLYAANVDIGSNRNKHINIAYEWMRRAYDAAATASVGADDEQTLHIQHLLGRCIWNMDDTCRQLHTEAKEAGSFRDALLSVHECHAWELADPKNATAANMIGPTAWTNRRSEFATRALPMVAAMEEEGNHDSEIEWVCAFFAEIRTFRLDTTQQRQQCAELKRLAQARIADASAASTLSSSLAAPATAMVVAGAEAARLAAERAAEAKTARLAAERAAEAEAEAARLASEAAAEAEAAHLAAEAARLAAAATAAEAVKEPDATPFVVAGDAGVAATTKSIADYGGTLSPTQRAEAYAAAAANDEKRVNKWTTWISNRRTKIKTNPANYPNKRAQLTRSVNRTHAIQKAIDAAGGDDDAVVMALADLKMAADLVVTTELQAMRAERITYLRMATLQLDAYRAAKDTPATDWFPLAAVERAAEAEAEAEAEAARLAAEAEAARLAAEAARMAAAASEAASNVSVEKTPQMGDQKEWQEKLYIDTAAQALPGTLDGIIMDAEGTETNQLAAAEPDATPFIITGDGGVAATTRYITNYGATLSSAQWAEAYVAAAANDKARVERWTTSITRYRTNIETNPMNSPKKRARITQRVNLTNAVRKAAREAIDADGGDDDDGIVRALADLQRAADAVVTTELQAMRAERRYRGIAALQQDAYRTAAGIPAIDWFPLTTIKRIVQLDAAKNLDDLTAYDTQPQPSQPMGMMNENECEARRMAVGRKLDTARNVTDDFVAAVSADLDIVKPSNAHTLDVAVRARGHQRMDREAIRGITVQFADEIEARIVQATEVGATFVENMRTRVTICTRVALVYAEDTRIQATLARLQKLLATAESKQKPLEPKGGGGAPSAAAEAAEAARTAEAAAAAKELEAARLAAAEPDATPFVVAGDGGVAATTRYITEYGGPLTAAQRVEAYVAAAANDERRVKEWTTSITRRRNGIKTNPMNSPRKRARIMHRVNDIDAVRKAIEAAGDKEGVVQALADLKRTADSVVTTELQAMRADRIASLGIAELQLVAYRAANNTPATSWFPLATVERIAQLDVAKNLYDLIAYDDILQQPQLVDEDECEARRLAVGSDIVHPPEGWDGDVNAPVPEDIDLTKDTDMHRLLMYAVCARGRQRADIAAMEHIILRYENNIAKALEDASNGKDGVDYATIQRAMVLLNHIADVYHDNVTIQTTRISLAAAAEAARLEAEAAFKEAEAGEKERVAAEAEAELEAAAGEKERVATAEAAEAARTAEAAARLAAEAGVKGLMNNIIDNAVVEAERVAAAATAAEAVKELEAEAADLAAEAARLEAEAAEAGRVAAAAARLAARLMIDVMDNVAPTAKAMASAAAETARLEAEAAAAEAKASAEAAETARLEAEAATAAEVVKELEAEAARLEAEVAEAERVAAAEAARLEEAEIGAFRAIDAASLRGDGTTKPGPGMFANMYGKIETIRAYGSGWDANTAVAKRATSAILEFDEELDKQRAANPTLSAAIDEYEACSTVSRRAAALDVEVGLSWADRLNATAIHVIVAASKVDDDPLALEAAKMIRDDPAAVPEVVRTAATALIATIRARVDAIAQINATKEEALRLPEGADEPSLDPLGAAYEHMAAICLQRGRSGDAAVRKAADAAIEAIDSQLPTLPGRSPLEEALDNIAMWTRANASVDGVSGTMLWVGIGDTLIRRAIAEAYAAFADGGNLDDDDAVMTACATLIKSKVPTHAERDEIKKLQGEILQVRREEEEHIGQSGNTPNQRRRQSTGGGGSPAEKTATEKDADRAAMLVGTAPAPVLPRFVYTGDQEAAVWGSSALFCRTVTDSEEGTTLLLDRCKDMNMGNDMAADVIPYRAAVAKVRDVGERWPDDTTTRTLGAPPDKRNTSEPDWGKQAYAAFGAFANMLPADAPADYYAMRALVSDDDSGTGAPPLLVAAAHIVDDAFTTDPGATAALYYAMACLPPGDRHSALTRLVDGAESSTHHDVLNLAAAIKYMCSGYPDCRLPVDDADQCATPGDSVHITRMLTAIIKVLETKAVRTFGEDVAMVLVGHALQMGTYSATRAATEAYSSTLPLGGAAAAVADPQNITGIVFNAIQHTDRAPADAVAKVITAKLDQFHGTRQSSAAAAVGLGTDITWLATLHEAADTRDLRYAPDVVVYAFGNFLSTGAQLYEAMDLDGGFDVEMLRWLHRTSGWMDPSPATAVIFGDTNDDEAALAWLGASVDAYERHEADTAVLRDTDVPRDTDVYDPGTATPTHMPFSPTLKSTNRAAKRAALLRKGALLIKELDVDRGLNDAATLLIRSVEVTNVVPTPGTAFTPARGPARQYLRRDRSSAGFAENANELRDLWGKIVKVGDPAVSEKVQELLGPIMADKVPNPDDLAAFAAAISAPPAKSWSVHGGGLDEAALAQREVAAVDAKDFHRLEELVDYFTTPGAPITFWGDDGSDNDIDATPSTDAPTAAAAAVATAADVKTPQQQSANASPKGAAGANLMWDESPVTKTRKPRDAFSNQILIEHQSPRQHDELRLRDTLQPTDSDRFDTALHVEDLLEGADATDGFSTPVFQETPAQVRQQEREKRLAEAAIRDAEAAATKKQAAVERAKKAAANRAAQAKTTLSKQVAAAAKEEERVAATAAITTKRKKKKKKGGWSTAPPTGDD